MGGLTIGAIDVVFDPTITLGHILTAGAVVVTLIGWGIRMQLNMRLMTQKMAKIEHGTASWQ